MIGTLLSRAQAAADFQAVELREHQIEHDRSGRPRGPARAPLSPSAATSHLIAVAHEVALTTSVTIASSSTTRTRSPLTVKLRFDELDFCSLGVSLRSNAQPDFFFPSCPMILVQVMSTVGCNARRCADRDYGGLTRRPRNRLCMYTGLIRWWLTEMHPVGLTQRPSAYMPHTVAEAGDEWTRRSAGTRQIHRGDRTHHHDRIPEWPATTERDVVSQHRRSDLHHWHAR